MSLPNLGALRLAHRPEARTGKFGEITQEDAEEYWKDRGGEPTEEEKEGWEDDEKRYDVRRIPDPTDLEGIPFDKERKSFWVAKHRGRGHGDPRSRDNIKNLNWHRAETLAEWVATQYEQGDHPLTDPYKAPLSNEDIKQLAKEFPDYGIPIDYDNETPRPQNTDDDDYDESEHSGIVEHANALNAISIDVYGKWDPQYFRQPDLFSIKYEMKRLDLMDDAGVSGSRNHTALWWLLAGYFRNPALPDDEFDETAQTSARINVRLAMELPKPTLETLLQHYRTDEYRNPAAFANQMCILGAHLVHDACGESLIAPGANVAFFSEVFSDRLSFGWQFIGLNRRFYQAVYGHFRDSPMFRSQNINSILHVGVLRKLWSVAQKTLARILWENDTVMDMYPRGPMFDDSGFTTRSRDYILAHSKYYYDIFPKGLGATLSLPTHLDEPPEQPPQPQPAPLPQGMLGHMLRRLFGESAGDA